ncbi:MAG: Crp/Fnr family transcriptional regulator [Candidatus Krumholzibacteriota bacterium]|nr:Crp/Fnr family transcriptional regulator [Candidatus Krumholzibacteriota bacterium]
MKEILSKSEIFSGLPQDMLARIVSDGNFRSVIKGGLVFCEGDIGKDFFILVDGRIRLLKSTEEGREITVKIISPPESFAETILFANEYYPVTALAIENSRLFSLSRRVFTGYLDKKEFRDRFLTLLMKRLEYLADRILFLTSFDVEERFFRFLSENYGRHEKYNIDISKKEMAGAVGTIPETFSRLLNRLKTADIIEWDKNELTLAVGFWERSNIR